MHRQPVRPRFVFTFAWVRQVDRQATDRQTDQELFSWVLITDLTSFKCFIRFGGHERIFFIELDLRLHLISIIVVVLPLAAGYKPRGGDSAAQRPWCGH